SAKLPSHGKLEVTIKREEKFSVVRAIVGKNRIASFVNHSASGNCTIRDKKNGSSEISCGSNARSWVNPQIPRVLIENRQPMS
ncbi:MAG: hypothetical protein RR075_06305, partial [Pygmaiobacter sp.]